METKINIINDSKVVIFPVGNIKFYNSYKLKEDFLKVFDNYKEIIIDFGEVESVDSAGLGKFLLFHKKLQYNDGTLIFRNIKSDYVKNLFETISLDKVIKIEK